jgi:hypothetical protein
MLQPVALAVAANDATYLPKAYLIEEFVATDTYLANDQLIDVVGG